MSTIVSIVSYPFLPAKTGGQKGIALFYKYFSRGCRLTVITTNENTITAAEGYEVINNISNSKLRYINIFLFFFIYKTLKKLQATHLILEHPYYGWLGILLKRASGVKLIVHSHNIELLRWKSLGKWWWPLLSFYEKKIHRNADYNFFKTDKDKDFAIANFALKAEKCATITYGIEWNAIPAATERQQCRMKLQLQHNIKPGTTIFLFNGSLDYAPNLQAVKIILTAINPLLLQTSVLYKIIICGKGLPAEMNGLKEYADKNIIYTGFVEDISLYFKGADTFINPVVDGGGIQTKLVEALGYNLDVITTANGAVGVPLEIAGHKMKVVENRDWPAFANAMASGNNSTDIPAAFFEHFYWANIAAKANSFIES